MHRNTPNSLGFFPGMIARIDRCCCCHFQLHQMMNNESHLGVQSLASDVIIPWYLYRLFTLHVCSKSVKPRNSKTRIIHIDTDGVSFDRIERDRRRGTISPIIFCEYEWCRRYDMK